MAAVVFGEPGADDLTSALAGCHLIAPPILAMEMANVCISKCRRRPETADATLHLYRTWLRSDVELLPVETDAVVRSALATGLTAYDAAYLVLAIGTGADLVTLDKALVRAAEDARR